MKLVNTLKDTIFDKFSLLKKRETKVNNSHTSTTESKRTCELF